jgi:hypothetical protein
MLKAEVPHDTGKGPVHPTVKVIRAWNRIYVLKLVKNEVKLSSKHFTEGSSCACFYDWVAGQDGRTLFGEVLE